jgi:transcriptional regulator with XRE-family HTH domain
MSTNETDDVDLARAAFATALRVEMARAGLNKRSLGAASGLSEGTIGHYTRGEQTPRIPEMIRLAGALGVEVDVFFDRIMAEHRRIEAGAAAVTEEKVGL